MSRYIKLADALRVLADTCYLDEIDENMQKLPSIDIVRCKECIFADLDEEAKMYRCCSVSFRYWNKGEHFCADGERREP